MIDQQLALARSRIHAHISLRAAIDRKVIHAMAVARTRGLGQLYRAAAVRARAIQQGATK